MNLKSLIKDIPDFPKAGILFRDMTPLLQNPQALKFVSTELFKDIDMSRIDYIAGIESRGFILGAHIAAVHDKGFIPIRKAGKLPPPTKRKKYLLEYGEAELEVPFGSGNILIVDDVLATGGTLRTAIELCSETGYCVEDVAVLINLPALNDFKFRGREVRSLVQY